MHIHILGICGTFMGGIAALARAQGHRVTGSDQNIYPPMSDRLAALEIDVTPLDDLAQFSPRPDVVVVGNVMSRGAPAVEYVLNEGLTYTSGPQWLSENILASRRVIAVAGTHGKTTTASMVAWLLESAGLAPGFLIGGVPHNFGGTARLGAGEWFVVEADEYDTAFFDKRSKFVHYQPTVAILNNLEFDHADIFADLAAIATQFHHLVRIVPGRGALVVNDSDPALREVLERGLWSPLIKFCAPDGWSAALSEQQLRIEFEGAHRVAVKWALPGQHNANNAVAASAAATYAGVTAAQLQAGLATFAGVRRRADEIRPSGEVTVIDDFAHHPTAVRKTLHGLREHAAGARLIAVVELRSNTMKLGVHAKALDEALALADVAYVCAPTGLNLSFENAQVHTDTEKLLQQVLEQTGSGDTVVVMSNGGFANFSQRLALACDQRDSGDARAH
ncbi:MAG: UDP-N-acetylmuramate:L-alanyl-gamma-D-glutamyl-meso-diaminopimelate ligase [Gammaproteobacteria bacterium]